MLDNAGERALSAGVEHSKSGRFEQAREAFSSAESWALDHQEPLWPIALRFSASW